MEKGSTRNNKPPGRPAEFSPGCWEAMVEIIRTARSTQKPASVRKIAGQLKKSRKPAGKKVPSKSAIALKKMSMGFKWHAVKTKPKLNAKLWETRLLTAPPLGSDGERRGAT